jgi:sugar phosphate isomerase/epimerase
MFRNLSTQGLGISGVESEIIELALSYRFQGIDPDLTDMQLRAQEKGVPYARRLIDSAKLQLGPFPLPLDLADNDDKFRRGLEPLARLAADAKNLGCTRTVTTIPPASDDRPLHENFEFYRKRLAEVGQTLAKSGISLGIEFRAPAELRANRAFEFIRTFDELKKLAVAVGIENVGVVFDAWHCHVGGGSWEELKSVPIKQIVAVVLADAPSDTPKTELTEKDRLLPGTTRVIDSVAIVRWLNQNGYKGPIMTRPDRSQFPKTGRAQIVRQIADSFNETWTEAGLDSFLKPHFETIAAPPSTTASVAM